MTIENEDKEEEDTEDIDTPKAAYWTLVGKHGKRATPPSPPQHKALNINKKGKVKGTTVIKQTTSKKARQNE